VSAAGSHLPLLGLLALLVALPAEAQKKPLGAGERVDLNSATTAELMRLPGVGKKRAEAIVTARDKRPFRKTDEVMRVKGLSAGWYSKVKGVLSVGDAPTAPRPAEPARAAAKGG